MFSQPRSASVMLALLLASSAALAGPYLDQPLPGDEPVLFAPGIVSNGMNNRDMAITPDGREIYWSNNLREFGVSVIMVARQTGNGWSRPEVAPFSKDPAFIYLEPAISPDGKMVAMVSALRNEATRRLEYKIAVMELEMGYLNVLTDGKLDESPSFAPNGSMVIYATTTDRGQGQLAAVSVDGSIRQKLSTDDDVDEVREPAWSPLNTK